MSQSELIDPDEIQAQMRTIAADVTVGYGDQYPVADHDALVVRDEALLSRFEHAAQEDAVCFDLTAFHPPDGTAEDGVANFIEILCEAGLDPVDDYLRVFCDMGRGKDRDYDDAFMHIWFNDEVLIHTKCNPITGMKNGEIHERGYASYNGVGGKSEVVEQVKDLIMDHDPKDYRINELFF